MVLVAFYCVSSLSKLNGTTTTSVSLGYQHGAGFFGVRVFFYEYPAIFSSH